eukprot:751216-Hanusia_phi.AAC.1
MTWSTRCFNERCEEVNERNNLGWERRENCHHLRLVCWINELSELPLSLHLTIVLPLHSTTRLSRAECSTTPQPTPSHVHGRLQSRRERHHSSRLRQNFLSTGSHATLDGGWNIPVGSVASPGALGWTLRPRSSFRHAGEYQPPATRKTPGETARPWTSALEQQRC